MKLKSIKPIASHVPNVISEPNKTMGTKIPDIRSANCWIGAYMRKFWHVFKFTVNPEDLRPPNIEDSYN